MRMTRSRFLCSLALVPGLVLLAALLLPGGDSHAAPEPTEADHLLGLVVVEGDGLISVNVGANDPATIRVVHPSGREVPTRAIPAAEGGSGWLVFPAFDTVRDHTRHAVFHLVRGAARSATMVGEVVPVTDEVLPPTGIRGAWSDRVRGTIASSQLPVYDRDVPHWYLDRIPVGSGLNRALDPGGALSGRDQVLEVELVPTYRGLVKIHANWGGRDLGTQQQQSEGGPLTLRWTIPSTKVARESTSLTLTNEVKNPPRTHRTDVSKRVGDLWVDAIRLVGADRGRVGPATLRLQASGGTPFLLHLPNQKNGQPLVDGQRVQGGFLFAWQPEGRRAGHLDVGNHTEEIAYRLPTVDDRPWELMVGTAPRTHRMLPVRNARGEVLEQGRARADIERERKQSLAALADKAHLIITLAEFEAEARRLAAHRTQHGLPSAVVRLDALYHWYTRDNRLPQAIQAFLRDRVAWPDATRLQHVLLIGDASYDRTDIRTAVTEYSKPAGILPTMTVRSIYNGATASDAPYVTAEDGTPLGPIVGRFPAGNTLQVKTWIDRMIAYETAPPIEPNRRMLRFLTSEGRFGAVIDAQIERLFKRILSDRVPPAYDVELTYASKNSAFLWPPPEFNDKVIQGLNEGALFYTYVGHGFTQGFDTLRTPRAFFPILSVNDVPRVNTKGTPPVMFVLACSTAGFDHANQEGIGEMLIRSPRGPIAYFGATRVCHPAGNSVLGYAIAKHMGDIDDSGRLRIGNLLAAMRETSLPPSTGTTDRHLKTIRLMVKMLLPRTASKEDRENNVQVDPDLTRIVEESLEMYALLGDPGLTLALPRSDLKVEATESVDGAVVEVKVTGPVPVGTKMHVTLELPRDRTPDDLASVGRVTDRTQFPIIRKNHALANLLAIDGKDLEMTADGVLVTLTLPAGETDGLVVKAWCQTDKDVHQGATRLGP